MILLIILILILFKFVFEIIEFTNNIFKLVSEIVEFKNDFVLFSKSLFVRNIICNWRAKRAREKIALF